MKIERKNAGTVRRIALIFLILLFFSILSSVVYFVARRVSSEMSESAVVNLSESLELIKDTIQTIRKKDAEFQKMIAREVAQLDNPEDFLQHYPISETMVKISVISAGKTKGISNSGEEFTAKELDFSSGMTIEELAVSESYINDMGTWAYTMKCPVMKGGKEAAVLYIEYIYDSLDDALPDKFYNNVATLYIMDAQSERLVLKPKGTGERAAGHLNLQDFYRANKILEENIHNKIAESIKAGKDVMFNHDILGRESLIYMWAVDEGDLYLIGYVPVGSIQKEGDAVNQNIYIVVFVMTTTFLVCCILYFFNNRQQNRIRREREYEREQHNKQLTEALQAAQVASNSKTTFLSNMSHDIRTPMNAILGFTTLLSKDADNPMKVREYTNKITASGQHLLSLINDVLDVSKIESGKAVLTIGEFTLNNMVSSVDAIIRPMAKSRKQTFDVTVTGIRNERLIGDETRLNQILINLLSNSVKYTPEGGNIWLRIIGLEQRSSQYEHIRIEVEDNGYGMTPEYLEVIFDAFTRAENSTTNKVQGTGLGMAITKSIVELMGGTIEVSSEVDKGSLFTVELELRIPDERTDEQFWQESGIQRILSIDDDKDIGENIQTLMRDTGIQVDLALDGEAALGQIRTAYEQDNRYGVILLDWKMPDMNGIEMARQIRSLVSDDTLIFSLTAYDWEGIQEEAVHAGVDGFLTKPFFVSAFKEKLLELQNISVSEEDEIEDTTMEGCHFLVVEDNEINSEILREFLTVENATCEVAENGQEALEVFTASEPGRFDAIFMDVQMPVMNGYAATKAIRALERDDAKTIPIIAMTANAFAEDVKDAKDAGMNEHIAKPINMETVKRTLGKYLKKEEHEL